MFPIAKKYVIWEPAPSKYLIPIMTSFLLFIMSLLLRCSPAKLNQLFIHLLRNANQACDNGAEILVSSRSDGDNIRIAISDTGRGISENNLGHIFDPGFTTRAAGIGVGLGLGLPLCYQIAQEHHGRIEVESRVGEGSKFTVILPLNFEE